MANNLRIVVLTGSSLPNLHTLATLVSSDLNVVGAVVANQKKYNLNTRYLRISLRKQGLMKVLLQIIERICYKVLNSKKDQVIFQSIFKKDTILEVINSFKENIFYTVNYNDDIVLDWISSKAPDLIVIHTPYWVPKKVRSIVKGNVIGSHPGITQFYRGIHSPFWAIYNGEIDKIGFSIFWVDGGVDSGDLIFQDRIIPDSQDSYITLSWKGMALIADSLKDILIKANSINDLPRIKNANITDDTIFYHPTIIQYIIYRIKYNYR